MSKEFEIYFYDLKEEAQQELLKMFNTSVEEENWDTIPLSIIEREEENYCDNPSCLKKDCGEHKNG